MNKIFKYILVSLATISCLFACTKADLLGAVGEQTQYGTHTFVNNDGEFICVRATHSNCTINPAPTNGDTTMYGNALYCFDGTFTITCNSQYSYWESFTIPKFTSQQCQSEYNLIPISEVTPNYCTLNFNMIDPSECPINSGTGAIVRSNLNINDTPYAQNQNINVYIPDFLAWTISFNDYTTAIEVEGYNADTDYIENVINQEKLTPTNEDFSNMLTGLANFFPYLAIAFIMFYLVKLLYKIFK